MFPDAPTERGVKHISELCDALKDGYEAYVFFIIQMRDALYFTPNKITHPKFAKILKNANNAGVHILSLCCNVSPVELEISEFVKVVL